MKKWKKIYSKEVFYKYGRGIEEVIFEMPDKREEKFYLHKEVDAAFVFALTKDNEVILVKQFRPGPENFTLEVPVGAVDEGEECIIAGGRELLEETGYKFNTIEHMTSVYRSVYGKAQNHLFVAKDCELVAPQNLDKNEDIEVVLQSVSEFKDNIKNIRCSHTIAMSYYTLNYLGLL